MFPVGVGKNICTAPFLDAQELLGAYPVESVCSREVGEKLSGERLNNVLQADSCFGLAKCFKVFNFTWNS